MSVERIYILIAVADYELATVSGFYLRTGPGENGSWLSGRRLTNAE
jgi:hypothetical protein